MPTSMCPARGFQRGYVPWNKGLTKAEAPQLSLCHKGQVPWNKQFVTSTCLICGRTFSVSPSYLKNGKRKCCSVKCMGAYRSKFIRLVHPDLEHSPVLSYVIGVLIGDGCVSCDRGRYNVILKVTDQEFALAFKHALETIKLHPRLNMGVPKGRLKTYYRVTASSNIFGEWYRALSRPALWSLVYIYPIDFLRGFYESEGTGCGSRVCFANTEKWKLELSAELLAGLGFKTSLYSFGRVLPRKTAYELHILGGKANRLAFLRLTNPCIKWGDHASCVSHRI